MGGMGRMEVGASNGSGAGVVCGMLSRFTHEPRLSAGWSRSRDGRTCRASVTGEPMLLVSRATPLTWAVAGTVSLVLFGVVVAQIDSASLAAAADRISWPLAVAGVAMLLGESLFGAIRTHLIARGHGGFTTAMKVTAWHSIWLIALPMRLGEVAWIVVMRRAYGWNTATSVACALVQRLLDVAVIAAFLLLVLPAVLGLGWEGGLPLAALTVAACLLTLAGALAPHVWLRLAARLVMRMGRPRGRWRRLLRYLRQGRRWLENVRHRRVMRPCLLLTVLLWTTVFTGQWLLCRAIGLDVALAELLFAAAGGSLVTALPIQSIGGIGLMEAGFTGILAWLGAPAATAALAALTIRFATWVAAGVFFLVAAVAGVMAGPALVESLRS